MERRGWSPMRRAALPCVCALLLLASTFGAHAADFFGTSIGGSVGVTSDYVYRGISHSQGEMAVQGDAHARVGNFQVGVWASTLEHPYAEDAVQIDGFVAYRWTLTPDWQVHTQFTHTAFENDPSPMGYDYDELSVSMSYQSRLSLGAAWIPNAARYRYWGIQRDDAYAYDATWLQPLVWNLYASLGVGYYDVSALYDSGYAYWHAGVLRALGPFNIEVLWIDSQERAEYLVPSAYRDEIAGQRWSAAVRWKF